MRATLEQFLLRKGTASLKECSQLISGCRARQQIESDKLYSLSLSYPIDKLKFIGQCSGKLLPFCSSSIGRRLFTGILCMLGA